MLSRLRCIMAYDAGLRKGKENINNSRLSSYPRVC